MYDIKEETLPLSDRVCSTLATPIQAYLDLTLICQHILMILKPLPSYLQIVHDADTSTYQLIVRRLAQRDSGVYTCLIQLLGSVNSPNPSKNGDLIVLSEYLKVLLYFVEGSTYKVSNG